MTDYQYQTVLKSIKMILSGCKDIEEAQRKLDELLQKDERQEKKND